MTSVHLRYVNGCEGELARRRHDGTPGASRRFTMRSGNSAQLGRAFDALQRQSKS